MTSTRKYLIVNADDFGQSAGVTRGIIEAFERGIVTSTSLLVRWPAATEAARYARAHPGLAVGLHLDFGEWVLDGGGWRQLYRTVDVHDSGQVQGEALRQLELFRSLLAADPTHLDSHQHVHLRTPVGAVAGEIAARLGIPLRHCAAEIAYCGDFYGQGENGEPRPEHIQAAALLRIIRHLRPGTTELACHPGYAGDLNTMYRTERRMEIRSLCSPVVRQGLGDCRVELRSFRDLQRGVSTLPVL